MQTGWGAVCHVAKMGGEGEGVDALRASQKRVCEVHAFSYAHAFNAHILTHTHMPILF